MDVNSESENEEKPKKKKAPKRGRKSKVTKPEEEATKNISQAPTPTALFPMRPLTIANLVEDLQAILEPISTSPENFNPTPPPNSPSQTNGSEDTKLKIGNEDLATKAAKEKEVGVGIADQTSGDTRTIKLKKLKPRAPKNIKITDYE